MLTLSVPKGTRIPVYIGKAIHEYIFSVLAANRLIGRSLLLWFATITALNH